MIDLKGHWDDHFLLNKFFYDNSYHVMIGMASFEALYGQRCLSPIGWFQVGEFNLIGPKIVYESTEKVLIIRERLKTTYS